MGNFIIRVKNDPSMSLYRLGNSERPDPIIKFSKGTRKKANKQNRIAEKDAEAIRKAIEDTYGYQVQVKKVATNTFDLIYQNLEWLPGIRDIYRTQFNMRTDFTTRLDSGEYLVRLKPRY